MTKLQKIWMWIFITMFALPEILWIPISNFIYSFFSRPINGFPQLLRSSFLFNCQYESILKFIILIQFIGVMAFLIFLVKNKKDIKSKVIFWVILTASLLIWLATFFVFYLVFMFKPAFIL
jgi:hypothetical protein